MTPKQFVDQYGIDLEMWACAHLQSLFEQSTQGPPRMISEYGKVYATVATFLDPRDSVDEVKRKLAYLMGTWAAANRGRSLVWRVQPQLHAEATDFESEIESTRVKFRFRAHTLPGLLSETPAVAAQEA